MICQLRRRQRRCDFDYFAGGDWLGDDAGRSHPFRITQIWALGRRAVTSDMRQKRKLAPRQESDLRTAQAKSVSAWTPMTGLFRAVLHRDDVTEVLVNLPREITVGSPPFR